MPASFANRDGARHPISGFQDEQAAIAAKIAEARFAADQSHPSSIRPDVRANSRRLSKMLETLPRKLPGLLLVAGYLLLPQGPASAADAKQGKAIAERWCASCHVVEQKQRSVATDQAPPFASIAAKPDFNAGRLAFLLLKPHPNMPQLALSRSEATDLAEYMLTLK